MEPVEIMFRTILCAVPAFMREDPARTSAPTSVTMAKSAVRSRGELRLQVRAMVRAPRRRAYSRTAMVKGVRPLLAIPSPMSRLPGFRFFISATARDVSSSLASVEAPRALGPPAMMYCTMLGSVLKVGGISDASSAADRGRDRGVFLVHEAHDFERRHTVEIGSGGEDLLGRQAAKIRFHFASWAQVMAFRVWVKQVIVLLAEARHAGLGSKACFRDAFSRKSSHRNRFSGGGRDLARICPAPEPAGRRQRFDNGVVKFRTDLLDRQVRAVWPGAIGQ